jgi:hypothetical protein
MRLSWSRLLCVCVLFPGFLLAGESPLRGPVCSGVWRSIKAGHNLVYLGGDRLLDWETSGRYRLWRYDRNRSGKIDPLPGDPVSEGAWKSIGEGHRLIYLGEGRLLDWEPESGRYRIFAADVTKDVWFEGEPVVEGTWGSIKTGHELIYLGGEAVLDWEPKTGHYRVWEYDRAVTGKGDPFPGKPLAEGTWGSIKTGHHLMQFNGDRVLDWEDNGHYRIWVYDLTARGKEDPFPGDPVAEGNFKTAGASTSFIYLDGDRVLEWDAQSGGYNIWSYEEQNVDAQAAADAAAEAIAEDAAAERAKAARQEHLIALERARKEAIANAVEDARDEAELARLQDELAAIKAKKQQDDAEVARARAEAQRRYEIELKKREVAKARQDEAIARQRALALTRQAVITIHNPITTSSQSVGIVYRWKLWDGSFTRWSQYRVPDKKNSWFSCPGAVNFEVKFSSSGGGEKKYSLLVNQIPSNVKATGEDGAAYSFYWAKPNPNAKATVLDMFKGKPKN